MKCFCCDADLIVKGKHVICPKCGVTLDSDSHVATVMPKAGYEYVSESFVCLTFISKYKPDVVLGPVQLFDKSFKLCNVQFFYKERKSSLAYAVPEGTVNVVTSKHLAETPRVYTLISMNGLISYKLREHMKNVLRSLDEWTGVPVLNWHSTDVFKAFFVLSSSLIVQSSNNLMYVKDFVTAVTKPNIASTNDCTDDEMALFSMCTNGVVNYVKNVIFQKPVTSIKLVLQERVRESLSSDVEWTSVTELDKFSKSVVSIYTQWRPALGDVKYCLFNPMCENFIDDGYKEALNGHSTCLSDWWNFLGIIRSDKCKYKVMSEVALRAMYDEFCNKG